MDAVVDLPVPPSPDAGTPSSIRQGVRPRPSGEKAGPDRRTRSMLYVGTAATAALVGLGVFLAWPVHHHDEQNRAQPHRTAMVVHPVVQQAAAIRSVSEADKQELLALRKSPTPDPKPIANSKAPVAVPASSVPKGSGDLHPPAPAAPAALPPATVYEVGSKARPAVTDPVDRAARLEAAPMATAEQVQVLQLVTEEASLIRQQRQELAQLRADQQGLHHAVDTVMADYGRRLSLAEAGKALAAARTTAQVALSDAAETPDAGSATAPTMNAPPRVAPIEVPLGSRHYRVQAASPRLAMLADQDSGAQLPIAPGDVLPGYGRVTAIAQYGTRWQVATEHGLVR